MKNRTEDSNVTVKVAIGQAVANNDFPSGKAYPSYKELFANLDKERTDSSEKI